MPLPALLSAVERFPRTRVARRLGRSSPCIFGCPNRAPKVVGEHGEFPIECIRKSSDGVLIGSSSHDNTVRSRACVARVPRFD
jgi:hypothetical protein